jgi:transcriptional regulator with XRE-family HTH domain
MKSGEWKAMGFSRRLSQLRRGKSLSQKDLAERIGLSKSQAQRYETGASQPTLEVIKKLAVALGVSADELLFDNDERGPDDELKLQFEALSRFSSEEKKFVKEVLDGIILRHEAKQWSSSA